MPSKIEFLQGDEPNKGSLIVTPCFFGYGTTLGNTLRRVLLSSLPGAAVEAFKIKGVQHEFTATDGVKEDMVEIILNLKQLAIKVFSEEPVTLTINKKGPGPVKAGDIEKNSNVEVISKDMVICHLTSNKSFEMELVVGRGRGFKPVEEKDKKTYDLGTIVIDSIYTPIKDVGYSVEYTRVGDITNYEKLTLNIETNGSISPEEAVRQSTQMLMDHFSIILAAAQEQSGPIEREIAPVAEVEEKPVKEKKEKPAKEEPVVETKVEEEADEEEKKDEKKDAKAKRKTNKKK